MSFPPSTPAALPPEGESGRVFIGDVTTEAGAVTPDVIVEFKRWGRLNDDCSNVILLEHVLTGSAHASDSSDEYYPAAGWWNGMIGSARALDTDEYCIVCTNVIGGCHGTTGPSSPHPDNSKLWGSRFSATSVRDTATVEHLVLQELGISRLQAVIDDSLSGVRALEWSLMHPDFVGKASVMCVGARASAWQIGIQSAQIRFVEPDPDWHGGDYYGHDVTPTRGLGFVCGVAHLTYRGELKMDDRFGVVAQPGENPLGSMRTEDRFQVESYLDHQVKKLAQRFDTGSYVVPTDTLNRHNIGRDHGGLSEALHSPAVPTMVAGVDTDILYLFHQQGHLACNLSNCIGLEKIESTAGHDRLLTEFERVDSIVRNFLAHDVSQASQLLSASTLTVRNTTPIPIME